MSSVNSNQSLIDSLNVPSAQTAAKKSGAGTGQIGQDEFLRLLITQLKNQDPLDPMKNDQFAVDMAQFTQVEQLIKINDQLSKSTNSDMGSMASYLGKEVVINASTISVTGGDGGRLRLGLAADASSVDVEILGSDGTVRETKSLGELAKGEHSVSLDSLSLSDGEYSFRVKAKSAQGGEINAGAQVAGIVSGFIPGADPKLLVGSRQLSLSDIIRVGLV